VRLRLKKGDIKAHWESVSSLNFFVISLNFGHNKDRHDSLLFKFPNTLLLLSPMIAAAAMSVSFVSVIVNYLILR
jgi:cation transport ATPase